MRVVTDMPLKRIEMHTLHERVKRNIVPMMGYCWFDLLFKQQQLLGHNQYLF